MEKCWRCKVELTKDNTRMKGYDINKYGLGGRICDNCQIREEEYQLEKFKGEYDE